MTIQNIIFTKWVVGRGESLLEERALRKFPNLASSSHQLTSSSSRQHLLEVPNLEVVQYSSTQVPGSPDPLFGLSSQLGNLADNSHLATALAQSPMTDFGSQFRGLILETHIRS